MNTLVIHPHDQSTDFLSMIYQTLDNKKVVRSGISKGMVKKLIKSYDRCFFMGHGTPNGLLSVGMFIDCWGFIIDTNVVSSLIYQKQNMYIWCHAKSFVERHNLHGIYTDMFISEISEADDFINITEEEIADSNRVFSKLVGDNIGKSNEEIYHTVKTEYTRFGRTNRIARFNSKRIYIR